MSKAKSITELHIERGTANVYADLGYADSGTMILKAHLVAQIAEVIRRRGLTQVQAAAKLGLTQPKVSSLLRGRFRGISERRLMDCLTRLGRDVQIVVRPSHREVGRLTVRIA